MFDKLKLLVPLMCLSACMGTDPQSAHSLDAVLAAPGAAQGPAAMPKGPAVAAPRQYQEYCARTPEECVIPHSAELSAAIAESQHLAQMMITPTSEEVDVWQSLSAPGAGDCEDFALTMRKQLRTQFPAFSAAFLIATAYTETDQYHAVLTIETDNGTLVCDIRYSQCASWKNFPYHWRLREIAGSDKWQELGPYRMTADERAASAMRASPAPATVAAEPAHLIDDTETAEETAPAPAVTSEDVAAGA
ncbi:MAG: hypothetical protein EP335_14575 [Alphaproteobacteria bacterium]|nr:MAG: hypothetical protein EP335_14575 [Alphaproteobacteria bacterium]